ncbi:MAG: S8 family serine peptidase [Fuerstiella sp.]|nr:S8 family serine peptidase [Fuerstiella sp.]
MLNCQMVPCGIASRCYVVLVVTACFAAPVTNEVTAQNRQSHTAPVAFPDKGLQPKEETGAAEFLQQFPEFDGRGIVVAVFDTGVDPSVSGLQFTSDGKPKIVDIIDGTGDGDVDMTLERKSVDGMLTGATGRALSISPKWNNPTGTFRVGYKFAFDLLPTQVTSRIKAGRRRKFDTAHSVLESSLRRRIQDWDSDSKSQTTSLAELELQLAQLETSAKTYNDVGPVYDCVVFHDGSVWQAVVDTDEDGDLRDESILTDYRRYRQTAILRHGSLMHFSVNVYDEGRTLSIVTTSGAHGTHVAGITAGHFAEHPELNGVAPGAQIVSVKIGDGRLGGMETALGIERGIQAVLRNRCDLVNMSFGEPTSTPNRGRLVELLAELVREHNVIFVGSAGNSGPALSTVGAPGGTTSALLGVGAYVSPSMMEVEYTLRKRIPQNAYSWTSRGPTFDGDMGVDIFAPGGAIAPVPRWTQQASMQMNGTSMASPNACGCIALLLSALKPNGLPFTAASIKRHLQNTAKRVTETDVFGQGAGLIQIPEAYNAIREAAVSAAGQPEYTISIGNQRGNRGIYLREPHETDRPWTNTVRVRPRFPREFPSRERQPVQSRLRLQSTQDWVEHGQFSVMTSDEIRFSIQIDPTNLAPGVHFAEINAFEVQTHSSGPLFRIPITVIRPEILGDGQLHVSGEYEFEAGTVKRRFIVVPPGATHAELKLKQLAGTASQSYIAHAMQMNPGRAFRHSETRKYVALKPDEESYLMISVTEGRTLEVCLAQYWSSLGTSRLEYDLTFRGVSLASPLVFGAGDASASVRITSNLRREKLSVTATLDRSRQTLTPKSTDIRLLSKDRDSLFDGRVVSQLALKYEFSQTDPGTVTPRFDIDAGLLYESRFGGHRWIIRNEHRQVKGMGDMFSESVSLPRGGYEIEFLLRHVDHQALAKLKSEKLILERPLSSPLSLKAYRSRADLQYETAEVSQNAWELGQSRVLYFAAPDSSHLESIGKTADQLLGRLVLGAGDRPPHPPEGFAIRLQLPKNTPTTNDEDLPWPADESAAVRTARLQRLRSWPPAAVAKDYESAQRDFAKEFPHDIDALRARLHWLDDVRFRKQRLPMVVRAADAVIRRVNRKELVTMLGTRSTDESTAAEHRTATERLSVLTDALYRKGRALGYMELPDVIAKFPIKDADSHDEAFEETFAELSRWVDTTQTDYVLLHVRHARRKGNPGEALKQLNKQIAKSSDNYWYFKKRRDIYQEAGWAHCYDQEWRRVLKMFPEKGQR